MELYQNAIKQHVPEFQAETDIYKNPVIQTMQLLPRISIIYTSLIRKANLFRLIYQETKDEKELIAALNTHKTADLLIDMMRYEFQEDDSKIIWRKYARESYDDAITAAFLLKDAEAALYYMEKSKAVLLADALSERNAQEQINLPQEKLDRINTLQAAIYEAAQKENDQTEQLKIKGELNKLLDSLKQKYPSYFHFKFNRQVLDVAMVQKDLLNDSTAFVSYYVNDSIIYALQISQETVQFEKIPFTENELEEWQEMLQWATKENLYNTKLKEEFLSRSKNLTTRLWKPISPKINRYLIAPDGWLNYLNFEMLAKENDNDGVEFLIDNNTFNYTWSATVLQYVNQAPPMASKQFLGIAPIVFTDSLNLNTLENSLTELTTIQNIIKGEGLTKEEANFKALTKKLAQDYRIIHWATHAQVDGDEPFIAVYDQKIPLSQIYLFDFSNTELVTLSACESSLGEWQEGEGVASIARACIYAGAQSVVASNWVVNDASTASLMEAFYQNIAKQLPKDEALRQAKLELLKKGMPPAHWASFVFVGNSSVLKGLEAKGWFSYWFVGLIFVLGIFVGYRWKVA